MNDLKKMRIWVNWKLSSKHGKIPKNPLTGRNAQSNNKETWSTYELADKMRDKYDGVGFMFTSGICGIDIDGTKDPVRAEMAREIISHMNTYTEYSPSGSGYHLIFRCDLSKIPQTLNKAYYQKNPKNGIECYFSDRFFTYTGEAINNLDIEDRTDQVLAFLNKYMKKNPPHQNAENIITIARKSRNFTALFDRGDLSKYNGDDSSADIALCNMLAFYTQGDPDKIDRFFRKSALYRDKWERQDYRTTTIEKAICLCKGKYYQKSKIDKISIEGVSEYLKEKGISVRCNVINHTLDITGADSKYGLEHLADILPIIAYDELKIIYKSCTKDYVKDAIKVIADINRYNPVIDMLNSAKWDGIDRIPEIFRILHLTDSDRLSKVLLYKWLWQCLSMARNDLTKGAYGADGILCLVGPQGIGKTSFFRKLAVRQEFFYEGQHINFNDKDTSRRASSSWICELGEVESTLRSDIEKLKAYITAANDMYRLPYGRADVHLARRTSLCATANSDQYLIDPSGNRRFWTVNVTDIDLDSLAKLDSIQLWAQVDTNTKRDRQGFRLSKEEQQSLNKRNDNHEKPIKAESEVRDILDLAKRGSENLAFRNVTVTEFKMSHESLRSYGVDAISKALNKLGIKSERQYIDGKQCRLRRLPMVQEWTTFQNTSISAGF